jgi:signal transduction histidine kinase
MMNLVLNAAEAMSTVEDRPRELLIGTKLAGDEEVFLSRLFAAFHTPKPNGLGMGLSISRSIVENHQGRLWAAANEGPGRPFSLLCPLLSAPSERTPLGADSVELPPSVGSAFNGLYG